VQSELRAANVTWTYYSYGKTKHGFTLMENGETNTVNINVLHIGQSANCCFCVLLLLANLEISWHCVTCLALSSLPYSIQPPLRSSFVAVSPGKLLQDSVFLCRATATTLYQTGNHGGRFVGF